ncbi:MAG: glycosyltransferase [Sphingobacteriaceae bacterium]
MFTTPNKRAVVSVINDLVSDVRVKKTCDELTLLGYDVLLIGRKLPSSLDVPKWSFKTKRMNLMFHKGVLFYLFFNVRLFFNLLVKKADLLVANDLDTLLPNYLVSKLKGIPLIFDSHEVFCEVPELQKTPFKKRIWQRLEAFVIPKLNYAMTVNESIAQYFETKYHTKFNVVRNIPPSIKNITHKTKKDLGIPEDKRMIILQGAGINIDRGAEELIEAMTFLSDVVLFIIGSGDVWPILEKKVNELNLSDRVKLIKKLPKADLINYTIHADLGLSIDKPTNLNYQLSLPNKVFDYIDAEVPILATRLKEIEALIIKHKIGAFIESHDPKHIADAINNALNLASIKAWKENTKLAKKVLNWEEERKVLINLVKSINV